MQVNKLKALLWDVDGVFVDTERLHFLAWQKLMEKFGKTLTLDEYAPMIGRGSKENMQHLCALKGIEGNPEELNKVRREFYEAFRKEGIPVLKENVLFAKEYKNKFPELKEAAVSSAARKDIEGNLKTAGLDGFFDAVISYEDKEGMARKPAPDIYLYTLQKLGVKAEECIAIEDSANGVSSANAAGIRCIALPNELTKDSGFSMAARVISWNAPRKVEDIIGL